MEDKALGKIQIPIKNPHKFETQTPSLVSLPSRKHSSKKRSLIKMRKHWVIIGLCTVIAGWIYFVPPTSILTVFPLVFFLTLIVFYISAFNRKLQVFSSLFVFLLLAISFFTGFDIISTLLLLSFIIVLSTLFNVE